MNDYEYEESYDDDMHEADEHYYSDCIERASDMNESFRGVE